MSRNWRRWTPKEDRYLRDNWCSMSMTAIAANLGRTVSSLENHAYVALDLGSRHRGGMTMQEAERYTGYGREALFRAARTLGIVLIIAPPKIDGSIRRIYALDDETVDRLAAWLNDNSRPRFVLGPDGRYKACVRCGRTGVRSTGAGLCGRCRWADRVKAGTHVASPGAWDPRPCADCGVVFEQGERKGRPHRLCPTCSRRHREDAWKRRNAAQRERRRSGPVRVLGVAA